MSGGALRQLLLGLAAPGGSRGRLMILTYHRVLARPDPLLPLEPDAALFEAQMTMLAAHCTVLPLPEAVRRLRAGELPRAAVCVTFDDGYRNNLDVAWPILRKLGLPASIFITQGAIETGIMWNDLAIEAVRHATGEIDLSAIGLGKAAVPEGGARSALLLKVLEALKYQPMQQRWNSALALHRTCAGGEPPRLMLDAAGLLTLAQAGIDLGAHTVNHPILAKLAEPEARREIQDGAEWLARITGRRPVSFAYPNGRPGRDFNATHMRLAREAGFELAVSTEWACAKRASSPFALPRVGLGDTRGPGVPWRVTKSFLASWREPPTYRGDQSPAGR